MKSGLAKQKPLCSATTARRLNAQEQQWLADLYQANFAAVFRLCHRILRSVDDAADATHEAFLVALDSMPADEPRAARSWLLTVARNHCIDLLRHRKRAGRLLVTLVDNPEDGSDVQSTVADRDLISEVLRRLPLRERQALWQSAVESRPIAEVATGLRLNYMAAAQVLHRARRHAAEVAARLAVVIGIARLVRAIRSGAVQRRLSDLTQSGIGFVSAERVLALAAVPLIAISIQSSSSTVPSSSSGSQQTTQLSVPLNPVSAYQLEPKPLPPNLAGNASVNDTLSGRADLPTGLRHVIATLPIPTPSLPALPLATPTLPPLP